MNPNQEVFGQKFDTIFANGLREADDFYSTVIPSHLSPGARPVHGANPAYCDDPNWSDLVLFYEYFHGDTGADMGASHQTGWTGLAAKLLQQSGEEEQAPAEEKQLTNTLLNTRKWTLYGETKNERREVADS